MTVKGEVKLGHQTVMCNKNSHLASKVCPYQRHDRDTWLVGCQLHCFNQLRVLIYINLTLSNNNNNTEFAKIATYIYYIPG